MTQPLKSHAAFAKLRRWRRRTGNGQSAHLFVCGRECGRELRGTRRTTRHHEHLSKIDLNPVLTQVKSRILRQGMEPAGGLEPPTPCLQDLVHAPPSVGLTCGNATTHSNTERSVRYTCDARVRA
jgi:hypothetical protein